MGLLNRLQLGLQTDLGIVFLSLMGALGLLLILYAVLAYIRRKQDAFSSVNRSYYDRIDSNSKEFTYTSNHKAEFWGRQTIVRFSNGTHGLCTIPPPSLADYLVKAKFQAFLNATHNQPGSTLAPYIWTKTDDQLILIQEKLVKQDGRLLLHLNYYLADKKLTEKNKESILLGIANTLQILHGLETETAEKLYHGFLLPRSIFLELDQHNNFKKVWLADTGFAYSIGSDALLKRLNQLRSGKLPIEKFPSLELQEQIPMLAPEQRTSGRLKEVGSQSDFFAFGALAVSMFTQKRYLDKNQIDWNLIPKRWQSFIEKCLWDAPEERPKNFKELENLTNFEEEELSSGKWDITSHIQEGNKYLQTPDWNMARKHFNRALVLDPHNAEANVKQAIAFFELGDIKSAEHHYTIAKEVDPKTAKAFHEHIAFKV